MFHNSRDFDECVEPRVRRVCAPRQSRVGIHQIEAGIFSSSRVTDNVLAVESFSITKEDRSNA